jgi:hypothetical protein
VKKLLVLALLLVAALPAAAAAPPMLATADVWPTWSPDGQTIAFTRLHQGRNLMELEVVNTRTRKVKKLAQNLFQLQPSWSPDGKSIAYQAGGDVWVTTLGGSKRRIGKGGSPAYGKTIARVVAGSLAVGGTVWAQNVIGRPAWSSDFTKIAFRRDNGIYTAAGSGGGVLLVGGANPGDPVWSPDGTQVAFTIRDEIWVASRGLVPAHAIARAKHAPTTPSWLPDGSAVVYTWRGGVTRTSLSGRSVLLHPASGVGAAVSRKGAITYAGPRPGCPGHSGIVVGSTPVTGTCVIAGTAKADVIEGTPLWGDVILAGAGNDRIYANDRHTDRVDCGPGRDAVWADRTDRLSGCEIVHR